MTTIEAADLRNAEGIKGLFLIHRAMRADLDALAAAATELDPSDADAARRLHLALGDVLKAIRVHHEAEDEIVFPEVRGRVPELGRVFDVLAADHHHLDDLLDTVVAALTVLSWPGGAGRADAHRTLVVASADLRDLLHAHLDVEETQIVPAWASAFTLEERLDVERRVTRHAPIRDVAFVLPWILAHATEEERGELWGELPFLFRALHRLVWQRRFVERRVAVLR